MTADCSIIRSLLPRDLMGNLSAEEQHLLNLHLAECKPCSREQAQYAETLQAMQAVGDVPIPRHFFVHPEERFQNPWQALCSLSLAWQGAVAAAILLLGFFAALAAFRLQIHREEGVWVVGFGRPHIAQVAPASTPVVDSAALKAEILKAIDERNRSEKLEWLRTLRGEIEKSNRSMTDRQRRIIAAALTDLETRLGSQMDATARGLEVRSESAISDLYQAVSTERQRDLAALNNRLDRLAVTSEIRGSQTDEILETLLQVADLGLK